MLWDHARATVTARGISMSRANPGSYLNVFSVREFDAASGRRARSWTKVGVAFPRRETPGFNVELFLLPLDGKLVMLPPVEEEHEPARHD
jgi:hypothetical protein